MKRILVIDANAPWVRSLFAAMKGRAEVHALNVHNALTGSRPKIGELFTWRQKPDGLWEKPLLVPGWTRFPGISTTIVRRAAEKVTRRLGGVDLIVYTLPMYSKVAAALAGRVRQVYQAHDPFRFYDWDVHRTIESERQMLAACDGAFAVAKALAEDLQQMTSMPVFYCPNAVATTFLDKLSAPAGNEPAGFSGLTRPIVGCIGQINRSYDWGMIGAMADAMPRTTFAFVGPIFDEPPEVRRPMDAAMAKPNVKCLGKKPHDELPDYLRRFDVCFNPLAMTDHNHRRSPLRLYDYLATDRPILSTAVGEAQAHGSLIETFTTAQEGIDALNRMLSGNYRVDMPARSAYIQSNTWESRAAQFLSQIEQISG